ncbi:hypothetical protein IFM89_026704 [Coptis chinensis]|uniref:Uncharacterized protein n=1 Tax=Coptis chinensis TaxID=261450 RepID=A0A835J0N7_9MAGN|nr:hypothetical protein IFM89_026704 [Coptis chinensis]
MAMSRRFDWTKNWELQDVGDKEWLWDNIKDKWELDETRKEPTLALISGDEFRNKKSKWKRNFYTRYATYEELISHRPEQLSQQEWVQLIEFWDTPEHQSQEAGAPPSLGDLFVRTHTSSQAHDALDDQSREYIGRGVTPTRLLWLRLSSDNRVNDLESRLAEMQRVAQEKEEERRLEIEEIKRQAQEKR